MAFATRACMSFRGSEQLLQLIDQNSTAIHADIADLFGDRLDILKLSSLSSIRRQMSPEPQDLHPFGFDLPLVLTRDLRDRHRTGNNRIESKMVTESL